MKAVSKLQKAMMLSLPALIALSANAAPVTYNIDAAHTYPSFEADHMGGVSTWRGKFNATSGKIVLDREAQTGTMNVTVDVSSIDFGNDRLNQHAQSPDMFDVAKYPTATYEGKLVKFKDGAPTEVQGTLNLHGITKPVTLKIDHFLCKKHPMNGKEVCGANATANLNREEFGISYGKQLGFDMNVLLRIQVEAAPAPQI
ncbi:MAG TPA: YceI family protein [Steroidobacteraceae bacterium]|nr:YceI family protein [Steroidobacteraceae bacterium]